MDVYVPIPDSLTNSKMSIVGDQAQHNVPNNLGSQELCGTRSKCHQNGDVGGWSILRSLSENVGIPRNRGDTYEVYVHPTAKRPKLNEKSLEMCTESLGSETGSESGDDITLLALEATTTLIPPPPPKPQVVESFVTRKTMMSRSNSFPPPINSVGGSKHGRMVRSYTEDGRLVVRAISVGSLPRCFVAERSEGRLRLCFSERSSLGFKDEEPKEDESNVEAFEEEEKEFVEAEFNEEEEEAVEEAVEEEEEEEGGEAEAEEEEGTDGNSENFEGKIGNKKYERPSSRCKESGHEPKPMLNWKQHFWVAT